MQVVQVLQVVQVVQVNKASKDFNAFLVSRSTVHGSGFKVQGKHTSHRVPCTLYPVPLSLVFGLAGPSFTEVSEGKACRSINPLQTLMLFLVSRSTVHGSGFKVQGKRTSHLAPRTVYHAPLSLVFGLWSLVFSLWSSFMFFFP